MNTNNIVPKTFVSIKRMWHSPEIHAFIDHAEVGAKMEITDFVRALVEEIHGEKNRFFMLKKSDTLQSALAGADRILTEMKKETGKVV